MRPGTEDLLSVRDGEPVNAELRAAVERDALSARELERLTRVRGALAALPDVAPPPGMWDRIAAAERAPRFAHAGALRRAAGVGIAAAVAVAALVFLSSPTRPGGAEGGADEDPVARATPAPADDLPPAALGVGMPDVGTQIVPTSYGDLVAESGRLDRVLRQLSYQQPLMSAGMAGTIVGLEDRIAMIDEQLTFGSAHGLPQPQRAALWSERVELMNALVHVRFAQAQPTGF